MNEEEVCWKCGQVIENYWYSLCVVLKDGERIVYDEAMSEDTLASAKEEAEAEHGDNLDYMDSGLYCPHCLACM